MVTVKIEKIEILEILRLLSICCAFVNLNQKKEGIIILNWIP